jgi:4-diphosphocytidyl-2-C-methyl-D-erythritol kinase
VTALGARCPAKVNLALRVVGRRPDGYHEIVTVFQAVDLWDTLWAETAESLALTVEGDAVESGEPNLVVRAARLLQAECTEARGRGAKLRLRKGIPVGAGLGGGSSDAAGTLLLLTRLWGLSLDPSDLETLAARLGSDVPFFLYGGTALGRGRGERVDRLPPLPERPLLLGSPPFELSTPEVYAALRAPLTVGTADVTVPPLFVKFAEGNDFALAGNDLEVAVFQMHAELATFRDSLSQMGAELALVSGSGSTVFGLFRAGTDVTSIASDMRGKFPGWTVRESRTVASGVRVAPAVE